MPGNVMIPCASTREDDRAVPERSGYCPETARNCRDTPVTPGPSERPNPGAVPPQAAVTPGYFAADHSAKVRTGQAKPTT